MESIKEIQSQLQENTDRISEGEVLVFRCEFFLSLDDTHAVHGVVKSAIPTRMRTMSSV
jgi:hypothetical protein